MDFKFDFVVGLATFMLISFVSCQPSRLDLYGEFTNALADVAAECGNPEATSFRTQAMNCLQDTVFSLPVSRSQNETNSALRCLAAFKQIVSTCGKDNYITILEIIKVYEKIRAQIFTKLKELQVWSLPCTSEEVDKSINITRSCFEKRGILEKEPRRLFDRFCSLASGYRACLQEVYDNISQADCPNVRVETSVILSIYDEIKNGADDFAAVSRCLNTAVE